MPGQPRLAQSPDAGPATGGWDWPRTLAARGGAALQPAHLRRRPEPPQGTRLHCFVLDCSASMAAGGALARAKGVLLALMDEAYRRREQVALLCFAGTRVELRLPPRKAAAWNDDWIAPIGAGGGTPLSVAVAEAGQLLARHGGPARACEGWLWLLTDGRTRERPARPAAADQAAVVDFESGRVVLGRARGLAQDWGCRYMLASQWG
ncbi:MAG: VWA domain-containing protein [Burkholderiaceae bacterium]|jgi:magnesium chelatase subunit ChlD-like protein|nr:VWA domain-containing protein [Burkholderiaceae bacterium]